MGTGCWDSGSASAWTGWRDKSTWKFHSRLKKKQILWKLRTKATPIQLIILISPKPKIPNNDLFLSSVPGLLPKRLFEIHPPWWICIPWFPRSGIIANPQTWFLRPSLAGKLLHCHWRTQNHCHSWSPLLDYQVAEYICCYIYNPKVSSANFFGLICFRPRHCLNSRPSREICAWNYIYITIIIVIKY